MEELASVVIVKCNRLALSVCYMLGIISSKGIQFAIVSIFKYLSPMVAPVNSSV